MKVTEVIKTFYFLKLFNQCQRYIFVWCFYATVTWTIHDYRKVRVFYCQSKYYFVKDFITIFRATGFHRQAELFEQNFFYYEKNFPLDYQTRGGGKGGQNHPHSWPICLVCNSYETPAVEPTMICWRSLHRKKGSFKPSLK